MGKKKRRISKSKLNRSGGQATIDWGGSSKDFSNFMFAYINEFDTFCVKRKYLLLTPVITKESVVDGTAKFLRDNGCSLKVVLELLQTCLIGPAELDIDKANKFLSEHTAFLDKFDGMTLELMLMCLPMYKGGMNPSMDTVMDYYKSIWYEVHLYESSAIKNSETKIDFNSGSINSTLLGRL